MERLMTKEGFWNGIKDKCPNEMALFGRWIDAYKKDVSWQKLFNCEDTDHFDWNMDRIPVHDVKYHDLPDAMQIGILLTYFLSERPTVTPLDDPNISNIDPIRYFMEFSVKWFERHEEHNFITILKKAGYKQAKWKDCPRGSDPDYPCFSHPDKNDWVELYLTTTSPHGIMANKIYPRATQFNTSSQLKELLNETGQ